MNDLQLAFDYASLDAETRIVVQQRTNEIRTIARRAAMDIIEIGAKLIDVKARLGHGKFGAWLTAEFGWSQDTAGRFMSVSSKFGQIPQIAEFAPSALYLLASSSTTDEARQEALDRAGTGESITVAKAKQIIGEHAISSAPRPVIEQIARQAPELLDDIRSGEKTITEVKRQIKEAQRETRRQENAEKAEETADPLEAGAHFATILIDPPWDWGDEGDINQMGRAKPDYATMTIDQLRALPVGELADTDCHIYLWITNRSLPKGFDLLAAWGFRYVTCLTWVKPSFGMGNYFRGQTEHVLFGVKGSQMLKRHDMSTVFHAERGPNGHSSKPPMIYDIIESCSPGPYLEMFSRQRRDGWHAWGADSE